MAFGGGGNMKKSIIILIFIAYYSFAQTNVRNADFYLENQEYHKALFFYNKALKEDSLKYEILYNIGKCYFFLEKYQIAISYFDKSLEKYRETTGISNYYNERKNCDLYGISYYKAKSYLILNRNSKKALLIITNSPDTLIPDIPYLSSCAFKNYNGRYNLELLEKTLELYPKHLEAKRILDNIKLDKKTSTLPASSKKKKDKN